MSVRAFAGMLALVVILDADAQGITAQAIPAGKQLPETELKVLRQQLSALEGRVHELEKKADDAKNDGDDDAKEKKMNARLEAIEKAQQKLELEQEAKQQDGSGHARAPFVVYDKSDHPIFRVEVSDRGVARAVVGNPVGVRAVMFATDQEQKSGVLLITDQASNQNQGAMVAGKESSITLISTETNMSASLGGRADKTSGFSIQDGATPLTYLGSKTGKGGYMEINDAAGSKMVEAGALDVHKGYVLTHPFRSSVDPRGNPSVLMGGSGR